MKFTEQFETLVEDKSVESFCNSLYILNTGTTIISVNNSLFLSPGQFYLSSGNLGEENVSRYLVALNGGTALIIRKNYLK